MESTPTGQHYVLTVEPRTENKLLYRGRIWVDAEDFAVVRIEAAPAKNPSFWTKETKIEQVYAKVGDFWLPLSNQAAANPPRRPRIFHHRLSGLPDYGGQLRCVGGANWQISVEIRTGVRMAEAAASRAEQYSASEL